MEKLSICRVCLGEDIRLLSIVGTHLQQMYESLVLMPLETKDGRPILVCYICYARLQNCYELRKSCLQSEELFTQMLCCNESAQGKLQGINNKKRLTMDHVIHLSIGHELQKNADNVDVEALKCEVKLEANDGQDINEDALGENSVFDNIQSADSNDDFLITVKEEQTGYRKNDPTSKETTQDDQRNPEDFTSSNLKDHNLAQDTSRTVHNLTAADVTAVTSTNEVTFTLADDNKEKPTSVLRNERLQYMCDTCQQCYSSKCELERHVCLCSDMWKKYLSHDSSSSVCGSTTHSVKKPYQCNICSKSFSRIRHLTLHIRTHTGDKLYQCYICKKQFSNQNSLVSHMRTHTGEKPYQCHTCSKRYSQKNAFDHHMRTHAGEKPYNCDICKKKFTQKSHLIRHMRTHSGEKLFHCDICKKQLSSNFSLLCHLRTHTGEKLYECHTCNKQFSRKNSFDQHMRTHTGEKPYNCDICKKKFSQKCNLIRHVRTHSGEKLFQCNTCKKRFSSNCSLTDHLRIHTGEKPYQCYLCKKQFPYRKSLNCHMHKHTGEKPYQCDTCKKRFSKSSSLNDHIRRFTH